VNSLTNAGGQYKYVMQNARTINHASGIKKLTALMLGNGRQTVPACGRRQKMGILKEGKLKEAKNEL
jgi:hypothetical protein